MPNQPSLSPEQGQPEPSQTQDHPILALLRSTERRIKTNRKKTTAEPTRKRLKKRG